MHLAVACCKVGMEVMIEIDRSTHGAEDYGFFRVGEGEEAVHAMI